MGRDTVQSLFNECEFSFKSVGFKRQLNKVKVKGAVNKMEITDVRVRRIETNGRMRGIASITFNDEFVVHDIRVIDGDEGLFVAMPSKRTPDGEFRDIAHPINSNMRLKIQEAILNAYNTIAGPVKPQEETAVFETVNP